VGYFKRKLDRARARRLGRALNDHALDARPWETIPARPPKRRGFVRFATHERHPASQRRRGIFDEAYRLLRRDEVDEEIASRLYESLGWFDENLAAPELSDERAVFLFKSDAAECMRQVWTMLHALRDAGIWVEMQTFAKPGKVIYSDEHQVAVIPWADAESI
jgi:hypothetical protein